MKLEEGMYVRTKKGKIYKFKSNNSMARVPYMINCSYNIIDLIKKKDLILGKDGKIYEVSKVWKDYIFTTTKTKEGLTKTLVDYQIDKILTKEQFESMAYKVEKC